MKNIQANSSILVGSLTMKIYMIDRKKIMQEDKLIKYTLISKDDEEK